MLGLDAFTRCLKTKHGDSLCYLPCCWAELQITNMLAIPSRTASIITRCSSGSFIVEHASANDVHPDL